jgi:hypothetical protein
MEDNMRHDDADEFFKWASVHHPKYNEIVERTPLLSRYKMKQVAEKEISMTFLDYREQQEMQELSDDAKEQAGD